MSISFILCVLVAFLFSLVADVLKSDVEVVRVVRIV